MENEISPGVKVQVRVKDGAPTKQTLAPQGAAPLRGSGAERRRGLQSEEIADREKTVRSADHSFSDWQSHNPSDPSVSLSLDSSPKRGAKGALHHKHNRRGRPLCRPRSLSKNMCSRAQIREPRGSLRGSAAAAR